MSINNLEDIVVSLGAYKSAINSIDIKLDKKEFIETRKEIYDFMKNGVWYKAERDKIIEGEMFTVKVFGMTFNIKQR